METALIAVHLVIVTALAVIVLLQRSEGGGLGVGGGGSGPGGFMTGRGQANVLTRVTGVLGAAFFVTSLALGVVASRGAGPASVIDSVAPAPTAPAPGAPPAGGGVLDQLRGLQGGAGPGPVAPAEAPRP